MGFDLCAEVGVAELGQMLSSFGGSHKKFELPPVDSCALGLRSMCPAPFKLSPVTLPPLALDKAVKGRWSIQLMRCGPSPALQDPLPAFISDFLCRLPQGRFVYSSFFPDLHSALRSGPGWLDWFSGSRGLVKEIARAAPWWVLCYDIVHAADKDLLSFEVQ